MYRLEWGASTHAGRRRTRNEDAYLVAPPLFAVADGMGGHAAGHVAASMAVDILRSTHVDAIPTRPSVLDAVRSADRCIADAAATEPDYEDMGTTLCGIVATSPDTPTLLVFNVGDSRVYQLRGPDLHQLTRDHSVVQELVDGGHITVSEALAHPQRNVVTRSLGSGEALEIDWSTVPAGPGDRFLIASDGLTREMNDRDIATTLSSDGGPQSVADRLTRQALANGGRDNITVVVVDLVPTEAHELPIDPLSSDTNPRQAGDDTNPRRDRPAPAYPIVASLDLQQRPRLAQPALTRPGGTR